jgi:IS5 family transposase
VEKIFRQSVLIHGEDGQEKMQLSDTTVQGNNITYPTDAKLYKKVIDECNRWAKEYGIKQRQTYVHKSKDLMRDCYNPGHPRRKKKALASLRKLRTIAGRQVRELVRQLPAQILDQLKERLALYEKILNQKQSDRNKIYSTHKPFTVCISKGKAHKPYEFGHKVGITVGAKKLIITSVETFEENLHDSKTIEPLLDQMEKNGFNKPQEIVYDRGGRGKSEIKGTKISTPTKVLKTDSAYQKGKKRKKFRRRAAIEPVIGHLKSDFRMAENYLLHKSSLKMNALLSASAWNFKKWMKNINSLLQKLHQYYMLMTNRVKFSFPIIVIHFIQSFRTKFIPVLDQKN